MWTGIIFKLYASCIMPSSFLSPSFSFLFLFLFLSYPSLATELGCSRMTAGTKLNDYQSTSIDFGAAINRALCLQFPPAFPQSDWSLLSISADYTFSLEPFQ